MTGTSAQETSAPELSIIIVVCGQAAMSAVCVDSLCACSKPRMGEWEILVIDHGSGKTHQAQALAKKPGCRYLLSEHNAGLASGINRGLELCRGRFVLILNPDIVVCPGSIETMLKLLKSDPGIGIIGPRLLNPDGSLQHSRRRNYTMQSLLASRTPLKIIFKQALREHLMLDEYAESPADTDWLMGAALMSRRSTLLELGGMDERFFLYFEDVDLCRRAKERGLRVVYCPAAVMHHVHARASRRNFGLNTAALHHVSSAVKYFLKWHHPAR